MEIVIGACVGVLVVMLLYGMAIFYLHTTSFTSILDIFNQLTVGK